MWLEQDLAASLVNGIRWYPMYANQSANAHWQAKMVCSRMAASKRCVGSRAVSAPAS